MSTNKKSDKRLDLVSNVRHLKLPERLWKLVTKAAKNNRSIHDYIYTLIENDLIKRKMLKKSEKKKFLSK